MTTWEVVLVAALTLMVVLYTLRTWEARALHRLVVGLTKMVGAIADKKAEVNRDTDGEIVIRRTNG